MYTQVLQSQQSPDNMWKLQRIWDYIIIVSNTNAVMLFSMVGKLFSKSLSLSYKNMRRPYLK
jgi:hypothetical protein